MAIATDIVAGDAMVRMLLSVMVGPHCASVGIAILHRSTSNLGRLPILTSAGGFGEKQISPHRCLGGLRTVGVILALLGQSCRGATVQKTTVFV